MKEISRLENLTKDFERELEQVKYSNYYLIIIIIKLFFFSLQLRHTVRERSDTLQSKDKDLAALRKKEQSFRSIVESIQIKLDNELARNKDLDGQVRHNNNYFENFLVKILA